jgi:hypothetical protein
MQDALMMPLNGKSVPYTYSAPDSYTFVVTAPAPDALILPHIGNVRILPKHVLEPAFRQKRFASSYTTATPPESLVTSGPWRLKVAPREPSRRCWSAIRTGSAWMRKDGGCPTWTRSCSASRRTRMWPPRCSTPASWTGSTT